MKKGSLVRKVILTSWFQAAIPSIIVFILLPVFGSKYNLELESSGEIINSLIFSDLNSDNISEQIFSGKGIPYYHISVYDINQHIYDQWNIPGIIDPSVSKVFTGNFDRDQFREIYVFTHIEDSLFLNVNELLQPSGAKMERLFITRIGYINEEVTSFLNHTGFFDENGDGFEELYFQISTAFTQQPRKVYFYDLVNKRLHSSQYTASICLYPEMRDLDNDNRPEIYGLFSASGNYRSIVPYSDSSTWFMVFNDHLEFKFPPVEFPGFANGLETKGFRSSNFSGFILSHWVGGTDTSVMRSQIMVCDNRGKLLSYKLLNDFGYSTRIKLMVINTEKSDRIFLAGNPISEINESLEVIKTVELPFKKRFYTYQWDINNDNEDEIIQYFWEENKLVIYNSDLQELIRTDFNVASGPWRFSKQISDDKGVKSYLEAGTSGYFLSLDRNEYYYLMYLSFPGIYLFFYFFILSVKRFNTYQVVEKEGLKQRLLALQLQGIKSQLDPHFTFNTLNSIASLIYMEERESAYDYLNKFTLLLRGMLSDADRVYRSLGEELEFVTTYLELEKMRFGEKFNYIIETGDDISLREMVPKLAIQTFAENAIKHGLMPCAEGGILKIVVLLEGDYLKLSVEDNGIGREKSAGKSTSTGKGLKLTDEFYEILNQMNKKPIMHTITDLHNENGEPAGTRVDVMIPIDP